MKTLLNTTIKEKWQNVCNSPYFRLDHLENEAELKAMIQEAEQMLSPCAHCGGTRFRIEYLYVSRPFDGQNPDGKHPHKLYVGCRSGDYSKLDDICGMETRKIYAADDVEDFKEALRVICNAWNRRPAEQCCKKIA